jgi:hypothetical protein
MHLIFMPIPIFCVVMPCGPVSGYQIFGSIERGTFLRNVGNHLQNHTAPQRRPWYPSLLSWEQQVPDVHVFQQEDHTLLYAVANLNQR